MYWCATEFPDFSDRDAFAKQFHLANRGVKEKVEEKSVAKTIRTQKEMAKNWGKVKRRKEVDTENGDGYGIHDYDNVKSDNNNNFMNDNLACALIACAGVYVGECSHAPAYPCVCAYVCFDVCMSTFSQGMFACNCAAAAHLFLKKTFWCFNRMLATLLPNKLYHYYF